MASLTYSKTVTDWEILINAFLANSDDLAHLDPERGELQNLLSQVMGLGNEQIARKAQTQQASRDLEEKLRQGEALAARLRAGVRAKYGYKSEKLAEFQLRPFRRHGRASHDNPKPPQPEAPALDPTTED